MSLTLGSTEARFSGSATRYSATPIGFLASRSAHSATTLFLVLHRMSPMDGPSAGVFTCSSMAAR